MGLQTRVLSALLARYSKVGFQDTRLALEQADYVEQREGGRRGLPRALCRLQLRRLPPVHVAPEAHLAAMGRQ